MFACFPWQLQLFCTSQLTGKVPIQASWLETCKKNKQTDSLLIMHLTGLTSLFCCLVVGVLFCVCSLSLDFLKNTKPFNLRCDADVMVSEVTHLARFVKSVFTYSWKDLAKFLKAYHHVMFIKRQENLQVTISQDESITVFNKCTCHGFISRQHDNKISSEYPNCAQHLFKTEEKITPVKHVSCQLSKLNSVYDINHVKVNRFNCFDTHSTWMFEWCRALHSPAWSKVVHEETFSSCLTLKITWWYHSYYFPPTCFIFYGTSTTR